MFLLVIEEKYCVILIVQGENCNGFLTINNRYHTPVQHHANNICSSPYKLAFITSVSKFLFLSIMEENYCVKWVVPKENWSSFTEIMNSILTISTNTEYNVCSSKYGLAFFRILCDSISAILPFIFPPLMLWLYEWLKRSYVSDGVFKSKTDIVVRQSCLD
jgi:hypothetical protein